MSYREEKQAKIKRQYWEKAVDEYKRSHPEEYPGYSPPKKAKKKKRRPQTNQFDKSDTVKSPGKKQRVVTEGQYRKMVRQAIMTGRSVPPAKPTAKQTRHVENQTARKKKYMAYLGSDKWRQKRRAAIALLTEQRKRFPATYDLQVHHKTYKRLFNENVEEDLEILCRPCHSKEHGIDLQNPS